MTLPSAATVSRAPVAIIVVAVIAALIPTPAAWVERIYSRQFYLVTQNVVTRLSSVVGFALFDLFLIAALLGLAVWWWRAVRPAGRGARSLRAALGRMLLNTLAVAAALYLVFVAVWGLNYRRTPLTAKLDYDPFRVTPSTLSALAHESVARLNVLYAPADTVPWPTLGELPDRLAGGFDRVQRQLGAPRTAVAGRPKVTVLTAYFRRAGIDGMMNPFSLEVLVNHTVLPYERPFLVAHEWSHLAGYANEAEASFVGFLTCLAGDVQSRYSAWLLLAPQLVRHLPEDARNAVWAELDDGPATASPGHRGAPQSRRPDGSAKRISCV